MCIFSVHSIIKDPPFSKLDLISCRNVLIYMNSELQRRVVKTFHYALKPNGYLFLGSSEGVAGGTDQFSLINKPHRILQRRDTDSVHDERLRPSVDKHRSAPSTPSALLFDDSIDRSARRVIEPYSPAYFVIDRKHNVLRFSGPDTGQYLEPSSGTATLNLFSLLRRTLRPTVRAAVLAVETERRGLEREVSVPGADGGNQLVSLIVEPIEAGAIVVAFRATVQTRESSDHELQDFISLVPAKELHVSKAQLKAAVSELETYMEEAKSAHEEMQSVNEELQSTNEELETSKEELQSVNEELQTVNAELHDKNTLLGRINDDLQNLLESTQIATLFLDSEMKIRNFTPAMTTVFNLRPGDTGRPITDIASKLDYQKLVHDVEQVQRTLGMVEREICLGGKTTGTFLMRIRPYRTSDNRLDGTVLTFTDVTEMKLAQNGLLHLASIVQSSSEAIISANLDGTITSWNAGAERLYGFTADEAVGRSTTIIVPAELQDEELRMLARLQDGERIEHFETFRRRKDGSRVEVLVTLSPVKDAAGRPVGASKIAHDISERKRAEQNLAIVMRELSHRSKNLLSVIVAMAQQTAGFSSSVESFLARFNGRIQGLAKSHDLLIEQNWRGALLRDLVLHQMRPFTDESARLEVTGPEVTISPDAAQTLGLAIHELATNASKYGALSVPAGKVAVEWGTEDVSGQLRFHMSWRERGGPPVELPSHTGFGRRLIETVTALKLNGKVALTFAGDGVIWSVNAPAADVLKSTT